MYVHLVLFAQVCEATTSTSLACIAPMLSPMPELRDGESFMLNYTVIMDDAPGPDIAQADLRLFVLPDPIFLSVGVEMVPTGSNDTVITIRVRSPAVVTRAHDQP